MKASSISGVLLAAGPSSRFGGSRPKQLARIGGVPLVRRQAVVALASRLSELVVVVGWQAEQVAEALAALAVHIVVNRRYREGQSTSVQAGLERVSEAAAGALFIPVDQPGLTADVIDSLIERHELTGGPIVVPAYCGRRGAPVLFDRSLFSELRQIEGDAGGRQLFPAHRDEIVELELESERALEDVDTLSDLARFGG